jgi:hypothetical protein
VAIPNKSISHARFKIAGLSAESQPPQAAFCVGNGKALRASRVSVPENLYSIGALMNTLDTQKEADRLGDHKILSVVNSPEILSAQ